MVTFQIEHRLLDIMGLVSVGIFFTLLPILLARLICCIDSFRICLFQHISGSKISVPKENP